MLIDGARQRIRSRGCSARDLVIYHVDDVEAVWCDEALSNDGLIRPRQGGSSRSLILSIAYR